MLHVRCVLNSNAVIRWSKNLTHCQNANPLPMAQCHAMAENLHFDHLVTRLLFKTHLSQLISDAIPMAHRNGITYQLTLKL